MLDWLQSSMATHWSASPGLLVWRMGAALLLGGAVGVIYRWARRGESIPPTFLATLVLLSGVIAMATQIIGDNVARAFALVGALSVVRFRTVVKDTQDTAFVILAVVVGMAAGSNNLGVGLLGLGTLVLAAPLLWPPVRGGAAPKLENRVEVRVAPGAEAQAALEAALATLTDRIDLISAATSRQGASIDLVYRVRLRPGVGPAQLVAELHALEGVDAVDVRRAE